MRQLILKIKIWRVRFTDGVAQRLTDFFTKDPIVNILGFVHHTVSVAPTQFYFCSTKAVIGKIKINSVTALK